MVARMGCAGLVGRFAVETVLLLASTCTKEMRVRSHPNLTCRVPDEVFLIMHAIAETPSEFIVQARCLPDLPKRRRLSLLRPSGITRQISGDGDQMSAVRCVL